MCAEINIGKSRDATLILLAQGKSGNSINLLLTTSHKSKRHQLNNTLAKFTLNDQNSNDIDVITYHGQKTKIVTNVQVVEKFVQTFLKASLIILRRKCSSVTTRKYYFLNYIFFKLKSYSFRMYCTSNPKRSYKAGLSNW